MAFKLDDFLIEENSTNIDALRKIDDNQKGFLIVVEKGRLLGTLTDGDLRRAFLGGRSINDNIEGEFKTDCKAVSVGKGFEAVIDLFKNSGIEFLPIIDETRKVVNVITKKQMHCVLLKDINVDLNYDFLNIDEGLIEHEIFQRPWGFYKTAVLNGYYQSKVISIKPGASLSLQMHNRREEHWIIVHGKGLVQIGQSIFDVTGGSSLFIPKGCAHRLTNLSESESLIFVEVQLGDYFGEDDIIRFEDVYGRV